MATVREGEFDLAFESEAIDPVEEQKLDQIEVEHSSPETLLTQIGVEETNIKTIGVSGTKPKAGSGSLTERQSHLVVSQTSNN